MILLGPGFDQPWPYRPSIIAQDATPLRRRRVTRGDAIRPNAGVEARYQAQLDALVEEMGRSVAYWVRAAYRANEPEVAAVMAMDASPARILQAALRRLRRRWEVRFSQMADQLAKYFAQAAASRSDAQLQQILRRGGLTVKFQRTRAINDVLQAAVAENVGLIKSIPEQYLNQVEGHVMRSVQTGRDLSELSQTLQHQYGVTKRRAQLIARDQNNKLTAVVQRVRQTEAGIEEAIWLHSHAGKEPRPTHLANHGKRYNVKTGWFDPHEQEFVWPGTLINCRCVSAPVIPGLELGAP